jgi:hypothetical protein
MTVQSFSPYGDVVLFLSEGDESLLHVDVAQMSLGCKISPDNLLRELSESTEGLELCRLLVYPRFPGGYYSKYLVVKKWV